MPLPSLLLVALILWAPLPGVARDQGPTLLVLGDSLSAAYGLDTDEGWVSLLQRRLEGQGSSYQVVNGSISGETTAGGLSRLPGLLETHRPQVLVIALGANDGLRGFAFDTIRANLTRMIALARGAGSRILLAGVRLPPNYGAAYTEGFQAVFREVAAAEQVPLVPLLLAGVEGFDMMQADGIHPSAVAQGRILDNVWAELAPLLETGP
ncbi:MAG: arylesterase [Chromatiaceae bacterium]|jgi:acyl-CoA thioesterase-1